MATASRAQVGLNSSLSTAASAIGDAFFGGDPKLRMMGNYYGAIADLDRAKAERQRIGTMALQNLPLNIYVKDPNTGISYVDTDAANKVGLALMQSEQSVNPVQWTDAQNARPKMRIDSMKVLNPGDEAHSMLEGYTPDGFGGNATYKNPDPVAGANVGKINAEAASIQQKIDQTNKIGDAAMDINNYNVDPISGKVSVKAATPLAASVAMQGNPAQAMEAMSGQGTKLAQGESYIPPQNGIGSRAAGLTPEADGTTPSSITDTVDSSGQRIIRNNRTALNTTLAAQAAENYISDVSLLNQLDNAMPLMSTQNEVKIPGTGIAASWMLGETKISPSLFESAARSTMFKPNESQLIIAKNGIRAAFQTALAKGNGQVSNYEGQTFAGRIPNNNDPIEVWIQSAKELRDFMANKVSMGENILETNGQRDLLNKMKSTSPKSKSGIGSQAVQAPQGQTPSFSSEAEAASAGIPDGTKVIINGQSGTWYN